MKPWSNLASVVYRRTYSREIFDESDRHVGFEDWKRTVDRYVMGNVRGLSVPEQEIRELSILGYERKGTPAGRGVWFSGASTHELIGGAACNNCYFITSADWQSFILAQDLLMLGGGVGLSVEERYTSKLPKVKSNVKIFHKATKDADFIVPDSREGWNALLRRVLEAYFVTGKGFSYSTICVRGYGEKIVGFGGRASGPQPLIELIENLEKILGPRANRHVRPLDAADILCAIGAMVVSGNVRRSAIIIIGDPFDKEYLKAKRWSSGNIPNWRANANFSVVCEDIDDLHPLFWQTYSDGEPFGLVNRKNIQKYGRMGELKKDTAIGVNPCAEATLEHGEPCNLTEIPLMNLSGVEEFEKAARLLHRYAKRVTMQKYHDPTVDEVVKRNRRTGAGITGVLGSKLFNPHDLDRVYGAIQDEDRRYSKELGIPESIRTTVVKPSGTMSKVLDQDGYEGLHPAYSRYIIQRVRFSSIDPMIPLLRAAGHHMEPVINFDGTLDQRTLVVDFYVKAPDGCPVADEDFDTWKQLDVLKMAQRHWSDQSCSVTVYYRKEEIPKIKEWLRSNWSELKTISFLMHSGHQFKQAPKEPITADQYEKLSRKVKPLELTGDTGGEGEMLGGIECEGGACPVR